MMDNAWQERLVTGRPQLFIRRYRGHPFSPGYPLCADGWREIVVSLVERISEAAKEYPVQFCEISEWCGRLRIYWKSESKLPARVERCIEDAIARAEARSACTCITCGAEGRLFSSTGGRLLPLCSEHARGEPMPTRPGSENVHLVRIFAADKIETIKCRRYDRRLDAFVDVDRKVTVNQPIGKWCSAKNSQT